MECTNFFNIITSQNSGDNRIASRRNAGAEAAVVVADYRLQPGEKQGMEAEESARTARSPVIFFFLFRPLFSRTFCWSCQILMLDDGCVLC